MKLSHPLPGSKPTSGFGPRPVIETDAGPTSGFHAAQDFAAKRYTPILAAATGVVTVAGHVGTYGNVVYLDHADGYQTRYAHMVATPPVGVGWHADTGDVIGYVGSTGASTGDHLHFELRHHGKALDPIPYLSTTESDPDMIRLIRTDKGNIYVVNHGEGTYWNVHEGINADEVQTRIDWLKNQGMIEVHGLQPEAFLRGYVWSHATLSEVKTQKQAARNA